MMECMQIFTIEEHLSMLVILKIKLYVGHFKDIQTQLLNYHEDHKEQQKLEGSNKHHFPLFLCFVVYERVQGVNIKI